MYRIPSRNSTRKVPNFCADNNHDNWWKETQIWIEEHSNYSFIEVNISPNTPLVLFGSSYWIASGKSPRGNFDHAVIYCGDKMMHDPHPDKNGLDKDPTNAAFFTLMEQKPCSQTSKRFTLEIKETSIPVKMVTLIKGTNLKCSLCGKENIPYMVKIKNIHICYIYEEDIHNATMHKTRCGGGGGKDDNSVKESPKSLLEEPTKARVDV